MKILVAAVLIICGAAIIAASHSMSRITLSTDERAQIAEACTKCHRDSDNLEGDEGQAGEVHRIHANAECVTCHTSTSGLKTANKAHDTLQWAGIGIVAVTLAGIALNFVVARKRLADQETVNEKPPD
jgi:hypothetical protein